jgi:hypothetical protein
MGWQRNYTTRRQAIVNALVDKLKGINGNQDYLNDLMQNVHPRLQFWDDVDQFPAVNLNAGSETREYHMDGYRDRYLNITVRVYVNEENASDALDSLIEDIETVVESNGRLAYIDKQGNTQYTHDILVLSIDTDEGVLDPLGVAEILLQVHY